MSLGILALALIGAFMIALITAQVASWRGRDAAVWFLIGFFLGPIAIPALLIFGNEPKTQRSPASSRG